MAGLRAELVAVFSGRRIEVDVAGVLGLGDVDGGGGLVGEALDDAGGFGVGEGAAGERGDEDGGAAGGADLVDEDAEVGGVFGQGDVGFGFLVVVAELPVARAALAGGIPHGSLARGQGEREPVAAYLDRDKHLPVLLMPLH